MRDKLQVLLFAAAATVFAVARPTIQDIPTVVVEYQYSFAMWVVWK